jgi:hypothetical protein
MARFSLFFVIPETREAESSGIYSAPRMTVDPGQPLRGFRDDSIG